jgi:hypothetical protein
MLERHAEEILSRLRDSDLVLDVGGWASPFNRAQWILDSQPFETRGFYKNFGGPPSQGPKEEWFSKDTWVVKDICDREPWPFANKQFDFAVCSHTLEDLRDPLWVCSELVRVAKAGYIEVPSRLYESCRGVERPGQAGLSHHRWLVEIQGQHISFLQKFHMIHSDWRFALRESYRKNLTTTNSVTWMWWTNSFTFEEITIHGLDNMEAELRSFIDRVDPAPAWVLAADNVLRRLRDFSRRGVAWAGRRLTRSQSG